MEIIPDEERIDLFPEEIDISLVKCRKKFDSTRDFISSVCSIIEFERKSKKKILRDIVKKEQNGNFRLKFFFNGNEKEFIFKKSEEDSKVLHSYYESQKKESFVSVLEQGFITFIKYYYPLYNFKLSIYNLLNWIPEIEKINNNDSNKETVIRKMQDGIKNKKGMCLLISKKKINFTALSSNFKNIEVAKLQGFFFDSTGYSILDIIKKRNKTWLLLKDPFNQVINFKNQKIIKSYSKEKKGLFLFNLDFIGIFFSRVYFFWNPHIFSYSKISPIRTFKINAHRHIVDLTKNPQFRLTIKGKEQCFIVLENILKKGSFNNNFCTIQLYDNNSNTREFRRIKFDKDPISKEKINSNFCSLITLKESKERKEKENVYTIVVKSTNFNRNFEKEVKEELNELKFKIKVYSNNEINFEYIPIIPLNEILVIRNTFNDDTEIEEENSVLVGNEHSYSLKLEEELKTTEVKIKIETENNFQMDTNFSIVFLNNKKVLSKNSLGFSMVEYSIRSGVDYNFKVISVNKEKKIDYKITIESNEKLIVLPLKQKEKQEEEIIEKTEENEIEEVGEVKNEIKEVEKIEEKIEEKPEDIEIEEKETKIQKKENFNGLKNSSTNFEIDSNDKLFYTFSPISFVNVRSEKEELLPNYHVNSEAAKATPKETLLKNHVNKVDSAPFCSDSISKKINITMFPCSEKDNVLDEYNCSNDELADIKIKDKKKEEVPSESKIKEGDEKKSVLNEKPEEENNNDDEIEEKKEEKSSDEIEEENLVKTKQELDQITNLIKEEEKTIKKEENDFQKLLKENVDPVILKKKAKILKKKIRDVKQKKQLLSDHKKKFKRKLKKFEVKKKKKINFDANFNADGILHTQFGYTPKKSTFKIPKYKKMVFNQSTKSKYNSPALASGKKSKNMEEKNNQSKLKVIRNKKIRNVKERNVNSPNKLNQKGKNDGKTQNSLTTENDSNNTELTKTVSPNNRKTHQRNIKSKKNSKADYSDRTGSSNVVSPKKHLKKIMRKTEKSDREGSEKNKRSHKKGLKGNDNTDLKEITPSRRKQKNRKIRSKSYNNNDSNASSPNRKIKYKKKENNNSREMKNENGISKVFSNSQKGGKLQKNTRDKNNENVNDDLPKIISPFIGVLISKKGETENDEDSNFATINKIKSKGTKNKSEIDSEYNELNLEKLSANEREQLMAKRNNKKVNKGSINVGGNERERLKNNSKRFNKEKGDSSNNIDGSKKNIKNGRKNHNINGEMGEKNLENQHGNFVDGEFRENDDSNKTKNNFVKNLDDNRRKDGEILGKGSLNEESTKKGVSKERKGNVKKNEKKQKKRNQKNKKYDDDSNTHEQFIGFNTGKDYNLFDSPYHMNRKNKGKKKRRGGIKRKKTQGVENEILSQSNDLKEKERMIKLRKITEGDEKNEGTVDEGESELFGNKRKNKRNKNDKKGREKNQSGIHSREYNNNKRLFEKNKNKYYLNNHREPVLKEELGEIIMNSKISGYKKKKKKRKKGLIRKKNQNGFDKKYDELEIESFFAVNGNSKEYYKKKKKEFIKSRKKDDSQESDEYYIDEKTGKRTKKRRVKGDNSKNSETKIDYNDSQRKNENELKTGDNNKSDQHGEKKREGDSKSIVEYDGETTDEEEDRLRCGYYMFESFVDGLEKKKKKLNKERKTIEKLKEFIKLKNFNSKDTSKEEKMLKKMKDEFKRKVKIFEKLRLRVMKKKENLIRDVKSFQDRRGRRVNFEHFLLVKKKEDDILQRKYNYKKEKKKMKKVDLKKNIQIQTIFDLSDKKKKRSSYRNRKFRNLGSKQETRYFTPQLDMKKRKKLRFYGSNSEPRITKQHFRNYKSPYKYNYYKKKDSKKRKKLGVSRSIGQLYPEFEKYQYLRRNDGTKYDFSSPKYFTDIKRFSTPGDPNYEIPGYSIRFKKGYYIFSPTSDDEKK